MVDAGRTVVRVAGVSSYATLVTVYDETADADIGTNSSPTAGTTLVTVPGLVEGHIIKARQTIRIDGPWSAGRRVKAAGIIEDFTDPPAIADHPPITGGAYETWYQVSSSGYSTISASTLFGSQCLRIEDNGWTNGAYAIYEQIVPEPRPMESYHLRIEMLVDEVGCGDPDWMQTYQVGVMVNGTHRSTTGTIMPCTLIGEYTGPLTPGVDSADATQAVLVYGAALPAEPGDDLLIAFSTDVSTYSRNKTNIAPFSAMKIDNIRMGSGDCDPWGVPPVAVDAASPSSLLVVGGTEVMVKGVDITASTVKVYEYIPSPEAWELIGSYPGGLPIGPLRPHTTIVATQTMIVPGCAEPIEGEKPRTGPVVGTNKNSPIRIALGVRETNSPAPCEIGSDGGTRPPIRSGITAAAMAF